MLSLALPQTLTPDLILTLDLTSNPRRVLSLTLPTADEASCWLLSMRALLRLTTLGDREFTLYLLDLFKMADRQRVGAITAQNRRMALAFLNLELERTASPNPSPNPYPNPNPNPNPNITLTLTLYQALTQTQTQT